MYIITDSNQSTMDTTEISGLINFTTVGFENSSTFNFSTVGFENSTAITGSFMNNRLSRASGRVPSITSSNDWMRTLSFGLSCVFMIFGLFGNILTLIITSKSANRSKPYSILIMLLATTDTAAMLTRILNLLGPIQMNLISITNQVACVILDFVTALTKYTSTVAVELICIERFLVIFFPLKARRFLTSRNTVISVAACLLATLVSTSVFTVYSNDCRRDVTKSRSTASRSTEVAHARLASVILNQHVPMVVLLGITPLMVVKLIKQHAMRRRLTKTESKTGHFQTSVLLVSIVIAFIILTVIPNLVLLAFAANGIAIRGRNESFAVRFFKTVLNPVGQMANYSINFIFYNAFNADFRRKTLILLGCSRSYGKQAIRQKGSWPTDAMTSPS